MIRNYLDTRQLEALVAVVSIGTMTGAAKALGFSQSLVTRLLQDLEKDIGFDVLYRNGPRIALTEQGLAFFAHAELFLSGLSTISDGAREIASRRPHPIEVATIPAIAAGILPKALKMLDHRTLPTQVHLKSTSSENVVQAVLARSADIGIAVPPLENSGLEVHWIGEAPCVAVVSSSHELASLASITPKDLQNQRLIASANPYRLRMRINQILERHKVKAAGIIDNDATYVSLALAKEGLGVAIVESTTLSGAAVEGVKIIPLSFHIPFYWGVITATGRPMTPTVRALISSLEKSASLLNGFVKHSDKASLQNL